MSTEKIPTPPAAANEPPLSKSKRRHLPGLMSWVVGTLVLLALIGVALPTNGRVGPRSAQSRALAQAKSIGLALKIFAGDHDGEYPRAGLPGMPPAEVRNSNEAFAMLFPKYLTNETSFGNPLSAYQTRVPDNVYDTPYTGKPVRTLEPGENVYSYVAGLTDAVNPAAPLIADGTDGTGHYTTDRTKPGGVWEGKKAIVIRLDNSGGIETTIGPDNARYVPRRGGDPKVGGSNLLDATLYGKNAKLLDPAVDPSGEKH